MLFEKEKLLRRVNELGVKRYFGNRCIAPFTSMEGQLSKDEHYHEVPEKIEGSQFDINDMFVGRDRYLWLEKTISLLPKQEGCEVVGLFDFGDTGSGGNSGFESLLYVNREPYQGVDTNHKEVIFQNMEGKEVQLTFLLWSGLEGGGVHRDFYHRCRQAELAYLHKKTDELYYFGRAILESLEWMEEDSPQYHLLLSALNRSMLCIDWESSSDFYGSAEQAHQVLMTELEKAEKGTSVTVNAVGHTHIDVAWLWRLKHTREKAQRSFSTVLRLMEQYEDYIFLQTQPQLYEYIKEDCPQLYEKIKEKVAQGKWEAAGGMWVEADCNLSSGEALVRQVLYGTRFFEQEFGKKCEYLWLPDVFGYSWALPQILKQCEINTFMTTKISWNMFNTLPDDLFVWKGIDGTEILTYFIDTPEVGRSFKDRYSTYNGLMTPRAVIGNWKKFKNKDLSQETLLSYGYGDGGGGVNREMLELRRAMDRIPGVPNVKTTTAGEFFQKIHDKVEHTDRYVHTWDGELYLERHRGTYTTQGYNKKMNRFMENQLTQVEWLSSLAYLQGGSYAKEELDKIWKCVLLHQFHDIVPGSSIREVYEDSRVNYANALKLTEEVKKQVWDTVLKKQENTYSVYSVNSFAGKELVVFPKQEEDGYFTDAQGVVLESQHTKNGYEVLVDTKPFAAVEIRFVSEKKQQEEINSPFLFSENGLETPFYKISWNEDGRLTEIYDKEAQRNVLGDQQEGNVLEVFEDKPLGNDAWEIEIYYYEKMEKLSATEAPVITENGPLKAVLRFNYRYRDSDITQDMIVYRDFRRIDFRTHVSWHEKNKLLKAAFYTDIRTTKATYDIQFGHVERPNHWNQSWDMAKFEVCGQKWGDLSEQGYGVSLLNDCKYGYNAKENAIKLSLLRAPKYPDTTADMGEHEFTYSLYPHLGNAAEGGTIESSNQLNLPAQVIRGKFADPRSLVRISTPAIQIDAVKKAEDEACLIVRLHECRGGSCKGVLSSDYPVKKIVPCNLLEHDLGVAVQGDKIDISMKPFEMKTYKLYLS